MENDVHAELASLRTQLAQAEAELATCRQSEDHFRRLAENAIDLILLTTPEGQVRYVSPAAERLLGHAPEALVGRMSYELILPEDMPIATAAHVAALSGAPPSPVVYRVRAADGREVALEVIKQLVPDPETGAIHVQSISRDVSARVALERLQQEHIDTLEETDRLKDQFLGILSHELRTPINAIMGFGSALDDGLAGELTDAQRALTHKLLRGADQLMVLVNDLLDMSRIQAGKFSIIPEYLQLDEVVERTLAPLALQAQAGGLTLEAEIEPALPHFVADSHRVSQVLANLVTNAIKFTPAGSVTVRAYRADAHVRVEVTDTGIGIAAEDLAKLFSPFTQLDMSPTRSVQGVGLGLSIAKALVEAHGGSLGVDSRPGDGSTFWFSLPLTAAHPVLLEEA